MTGEKTKSISALCAASPMYVAESVNGIPIHATFCRLPGMRIGTAEADCSLVPLVENVSLEGKTY